MRESSSAGLFLRDIILAGDNADSHIELSRVNFAVGRRESQPMEPVGLTGCLFCREERPVAEAKAAPDNKAATREDGSLRAYWEPKLDCF